MGEFRFKRFTVRNEKSAMKVNTDGVLLGAAMTLLAGDAVCLDIGTGTGSIALMAAQRLTDMRESAAEIPDAAEPAPSHGDALNITAIDIDAPSAEEAAANFASSPWASSLTAVRSSLADFVPGTKYDLIFSNPPYFDNSLQAPEARRNASRHTDSLSYREIMLFAAEHLKEDGRLSLILPAQEETAMRRYASPLGLYPFRILHIRSTPKRQVSRVVMEFSRRRTDTERQEMFIQKEGAYSDEYRSLCASFLLNV